MLRKIGSEEELYTILDGMPLFYSDPTMDFLDDEIVVWMKFIVRDKTTKACLRWELVQMTLNEFGNKRLFNSRLSALLGCRLPLGGGDPSRWARYSRSFVWEAAEAAMDRGVKLPVEDERLGLWSYQRPIDRCANMLAA